MKKKFTQLRWLGTMLMLVAAMVMPSTAWAEGYDKNGFGSDESAPYQPATLTTDKYDIDGDGKNDEVYEIGNAGQLYWFADKVNNDNTNFGSANAVLTADIIVNTGVLDENGNLSSNTSGFRSWTPIGGGSGSVKYTGIFDGNNKSISGLYYNVNVESSVDIFRAGFFSWNNGTIKNLSVINSYFGLDFSGTYFWFGGLSGSNDGTIENCNYAGTVSVSGTNEGGYVGGICGSNRGITKNCNNTGIISSRVNDPAVNEPADVSVGGVSGVNGYLGIIERCSNTGEVSGTTNVGGVCGLNSNGTITNCYYLANEDDKNGGKEETQFKSGEVAYLLAQGCTVGETFYDGSVWGQQLGVNDYPVLGSAYKVLMAAQDGLEGSIYWATFSDLNSNAELIDPKGDITVYNATVSSGTLTLAKRSDNNVSSGEGVLLKANSEYVNAKNISDYVAATTGENDLLATPKDAGVINAGTGYTLYRLTYNKTSTKEGLGFYLGLVGDSKDGSQLKATPGKAYLNVLTSEAKLQSSAAPARGFAFPGDDDATGIECITVTDEELHKNGNAKGIFDLQGRKVSKPTKGVYIKNNKLFLN